MHYKDLKAQYNILQNQIDEAISEVLNEASFISGPQVAELETVLAGYVDIKHCITCGNGTEALTLALMSWNIEEGDAVFVPDFTFFASGEAPASLGATPIFVDVDERTYNLDPDKLEAAIEHVVNNTNLRLGAVIAVDLYGLPANYPSIRSVCNKYGIKLLEDCAQGFGGAIGDKRLCSFGDISCTSFFPAKPYGCYGDGGAIFTDNDEWAEIIRSYAVHGKGTMKYDNVRLGVNSRLDTIQAAVLLAKFTPYVDFELKEVNRIASLYSHLLNGNDLVLPYVPSNYLSAWAMYTIQLPDYIDRDSFKSELSEMGIPTMVYYPKPMHDQLAFSTDSPDQRKGYSLDDCPITTNLCKKVLTLPIGPYMPQDDVQYVVSSVNRLLENEG